VANHLKMALVETIRSLHQRGWSQRRIAEELGIHRETVARHLGQASESKPAIAPPGSEGVPADPKPAIAPPGSEGVPADSKPAIAPPGSEASSPASNRGRASDCAAWRSVIAVLREQGLTAQRIYQDLTSEHGYTGSYYSIRRFVAKLGCSRELPFRRIECAPGEEVQVDFGVGAPLVRGDGTRSKTHVFRVVLSYSRKAYSEVVLRQTTEAFVRALENAFWHFGGVPRRVVLDNLRAAVKKADWFDPELNPKVEAFAAHYGFAFAPTRPYLPRHKGKVERGVGYVKDNALKGRVFESLAEENHFLANWEETIADRRIHGTTRRQVGALFSEVERAALQALPIGHFPCFQEVQRTVHRDGHIELSRAYYSVPPEYLGCRVWVRWDGRLVRIFNEKLASIAVHAQVEPGRFSTRDEDISSRKRTVIERGSVWLLTQIGRIGSDAQRWGEALLAARGVESIRVLQGLLSLAQRHRYDQIDRACAIALTYGAFRLRTLRELIDREVPRQGEIEFTSEHELIRPLAEYGDFIAKTQSDASGGEESTS
jgi:transposase